MSIIKPSNKFKGRRFTFGRYNGQLIETVVLKYPDYINWLFQQPSNSTLTRLQDYIQQCITIFDKLPFTSVKCRNVINCVACTSPVERFTLRQGSLTPHYWCAACYDVQRAALNVADAGGYGDAIEHVNLDAYRNWGYYRIIIRHLAEAKGYNGNFTEAKVIRFFYGPDAKVSLPDPV